MGCLFSAEAPAPASSSTPLLDGPAPGLKFTRAASEAKPAAAARLPTFKRPVPTSGPARAAQQGVGIFCACGGPGSLVELLPCSHHALCLSCAQVKPACPVCSAKIQDSVPSFRVAAEPSEPAQL